MAKEPSERELSERKRVGQVLLVARTKKGQSQDEAAAILGVSGSTVGTYERGEQPMPLDVRQTLVSEYGVEPSEVGLVIEVVSLSRDVDEFLTAAFNLALANLSNPETPADQRNLGSKVLERYRDIKAKTT